jgi:cytidylate kinase
MSVRIITIEREYGSGGAFIARELAQRLGWKFWDQELTAEIAQMAHVNTKAAERCDERVDSLVYRLFKVYARGSYERALPIEGEAEGFDTDRMVALLHKVIEDVASRENCVIVGRGSTYILRNRPDAAHFFIYAPVEDKIRRLRDAGKPELEARKLVAEIDRERASFIRHYFQAEWPNRALYNLMINSHFGDEHVIETILHHVAFLDTRMQSASSRAVSS